MAVPFLMSQFSALNLETSLKSAIEQSLQSVISTFIINLTAKELLLPEKRQRFKSKPLKEKTPSPPPKPKNDKKAREEQFEEHKKKTDETKTFTKKLIEERRERDKKKQERERDYRLKALQDMEEQRKQQEEMMKKFEEEKQFKINNLVKKGEVRKKDLEGKKDEISKSPLKKKPLFKHMEDHYKQQVLLPQLEHHKAEIAKKKILFKPLDPEELKEHSKHHDDLKRQFEYRRKKEIQQKNLDAQLNLASNNLQSKFTASILEEAKRKKEEEERTLQEKMMNIHKRLQYSKLVKEMFPPLVSDLKRIETEFEPKKQTKSAEVSRTEGEKKKIGVTDYKSDIGLRPIRYRRKEPEIKKEIVVTDYLAEQRNERAKNPVEAKVLKIDLKQELEEQEIDEKKLEKIKAKAEKIDRQAKQKEMMLEKMKVEGVKSVEAGDEVNDMIISSIKAKLALLDKFHAL